MSWRPRDRESNRMPVSNHVRLDQHRQLTVLPHYFIKKGDTKQTGHNNCAPMGGSSVSAARLRYQVLIDGV